MKKYYKLLKNITFALAISWILSFNVFAVKATDCNFSIKGSEKSTIDIETSNYANEVEKGDVFKVFVKNFNDYEIQYTVLLWDKKKTLKFSENKTLDVYHSARNTSVMNVTTDKLNYEDYQVEVRLYNPGRDCMIKSKTQNIKVVKVLSTDTPGIEWFNRGNVKIGFFDKEIKSNETFRITMENQGQNDLDYIIKADNLKTGEFLTKQGGTILGHTAQTTMINITSVGKHTVQVIFYYAGQTQPLTFYGQSYEVNVIEENAVTTDSSKTEEAVVADPSTIITVKKIDSDSQIANDSSDTGISPTIGNIFKAIFTNGDAADADLSSINKLIVEVTNYALNFAGIIAFVMILWASIKYLTAYGADETAAIGKKTLLWAAIGLFVILISKGILSWIISTFN